MLAEEAPEPRQRLGAAHVAERLERGQPHRPAPAADIPRSQHVEERLHHGGPAALAGQLDRCRRRARVGVRDRGDEVVLPRRGVQLQQASEGLEPDPEVGVRGEAPHRRQRRPVPDPPQQGDDVPDHVPVRIHEPACRLRHHVGAERGQEVEDAAPPDPDLLLDQHLEEAPDGAGAEQANQPDRRRARRRSEGRGQDRERLGIGELVEVAAKRGARRLPHGLVGGEPRHAFDRERRLV